VKGVYRAEFGEGRSIADQALLGAILDGLGLDGPSLLRSAGEEANKARLKAQCEEARARGIFGAPTFIAPDGELFWGNDRLERALAWVVTGPG
jgi:2-hydroxychromene-2-carboxylate isomerase